MDTALTLMLSSNNLWIVAELRAGGEPVVVPQITLHIANDQEHYGVFAPNAESLASLQGELRGLLTSDFPLIAKYGVKHFGVTQLTWNEGCYSLSDEHPVTSPPSRGVWVASLTTPKGVSEDATVPWTLHLRSGGQMVCSCPSVGEAALFLGRVRSALDQILPVGGEFPLPSSQEAPQMFLRMKVDLHAYERVLTKTGLNLLAHLVGPKFLRLPAFDNAVSYVLSRNDLKVRSVQSSELSSLPKLENHHVFIIIGQRKRSMGPWHILLIAQLYGGLPTILQLGVTATRPEPMREPIIVQVDFTKNIIRRRTLDQHAADLWHASDSGFDWSLIM